MNLHSGADREDEPLLQRALSSAISLLHCVGSELGVQSSTSQFLLRVPEADFHTWVRSEYVRRGRRRRYFPSITIGEPCWDMLLDLAAARLENKQISTSSACYGSGVPQSTALRWLKVMEDEGLVLRVPAADDKRKSFIEISETGLTALERYYEACILQPAR